MSIEKSFYSRRRVDTCGIPFARNASTRPIFSLLFKFNVNSCIEMYAFSHFQVFMNIIKYNGRRLLNIVVFSAPFSCFLRACAFPLIWLLLRQVHYTFSSCEIRGVPGSAG